jgi:hypothetical protein
MELPFLVMRLSEETDSKADSSDHTKPHRGTQVAFLPLPFPKGKLKIRKTGKAGAG